MRRPRSCFSSVEPRDFCDDEAAGPDAAAVGRGDGAVMAVLTVEGMGSAAVELGAGVNAAAAGFGLAAAGDRSGIATGSKRFLAGPDCVTGVAAALAYDLAGGGGGAGAGAGVGPDWLAHSLAR